jgi:hypothetical protein
MFYERFNHPLYLHWLINPEYQVGSAHPTFTAIDRRIDIAHDRKFGIAI